MIKIYENDAYIKEFVTKIAEIKKIEKLIELKETAFYAKGGGQPGDKGVLINNNQEIKVINTIKIENKIYHEVESIEKISLEETIEGKINWKIRYKHMRMHSALHLMCSIIPMGVTGGQIGFEKSRLDFNDPDKKINKEEVEEKLNELVSEDHKITYELIDSKVLEEKPEIVRTMSVKPPQINGKLD